MLEYTRLSTAVCIDKDTDCRYHYVYGYKDRFNPHCHDFYEIFVTISGTVTHIINGITQKLPEGTMVFIRPDDYHGYVYDTPESRNTEYINFAFTCETARMLFAYLADGNAANNLLCCDMPPAVLLSKSQKERLLARIQELSVVNWENRQLLKLRMRAILVDIFAEFFFQLPQKRNDTVVQWLSDLMLEMEKPEHFVVGMERLLSLSNKSREHVLRSVKKYYGITAAEYINDLRLNYAANLLRHTNSDILDICYGCGFQSQSYFYKVFKNKYGVSPKAFRVQYQNPHDI